VLDKKLLQILVCPVTKAPLDYDEAKQELVCKASGLAYPVRDGIPVLLEVRHDSSRLMRSWGRSRGRHDIWKNYPRRNTDRLPVRG
jgi:uncharacterized protein YbaR (Trm112 family)